MRHLISTSPATFFLVLVTLAACSADDGSSFPNFVNDDSGTGWGEGGEGGGAGSDGEQGGGAGSPASVGGSSGDIAGTGGVAPETGGQGGTVAGGSAGSSSGAGGLPGIGGFLQDAGQDSTPQEDSSAPDSSDPQDAPVCSTQDYEAQPSPVDIYIMMDKSGSMTDTAGTTAQTKWEAVRAALTTFLNDPQSAGLGVGVQFFPLPASTLASCNGSCSGWNDLCVYDDETYTSAHCYTQCNNNSECGDDECVPTTDPTIKLCGNDSCSIAHYAAPEIGIAVLPAAASGLVTAINQQEASGATPTLPAIHGAVEYAQSWASQNPTHKVVVVLATDGLPTVCPVVETISEQDGVVAQVALVASAAANGPSKIPTFVIGVMAASDGSQQNLDSIAQAGGTDQAFIVDPSQDVTAQFTQALNEIRGAVLACEFLLPQTEEPLDFGKVNVKYTAPTGESGTIWYVPQPAECDPVYGGWYYDISPIAGTPTKILMCPTTCDALQTIGGKIEIVIGCKTEISPWE